jgi:broad specificity phosphatase PhoE
MLDVIQRVRSFLHDAQARHHGRRVLLVAHDSVVLGLRFILEELDEAQWSAAGPVPNASITRWKPVEHGWDLVERNSVAHLHREREE